MMPSLMLLAEGGSKSVFGAPLISQLLAFALLMLLFVKYVFPLLKKTLQERSQGIQGQFDTAEQENRAAAEETARTRKSLDEIHLESERRIRAAIEEGRKLGAKSLSDTQQQAQEAFTKAQSDIRIAQDKCVLELRSLLARRAMEATEKALQTVLTDALNQKLVEQSLQGLEKAAAQK